MSEQFRYQEALRRAGVPARTVERFFRWHSKNPEVWHAFEKLALTLIQSGVRRYGAKSVMEVVRWHKTRVKRGRWKIDNNYAAYYARIFRIKYPEHAQLFQLREVRGLKEKEGNEIRNAR